MNSFNSLVNYCLDCSTKPCKKGCPLENDIPKFIETSKNNDFLKAFSVLSETTVLSSICGRICLFDEQCEKNCVRRLEGNSVRIGEIEAYIGDKAIKEDYPLFSNMEKNNGKTIAVIGGGPAGLTCAAFLRKMGYKVTIYEKYNYLGGIISHGIPDFRLNYEVVDLSIKKIINLGIDVKYNQELGKNLSLKKLKKEYDAVFLSFGANKSKVLNIKGKNLENVMGVNDFLESRKRINFNKKNVVVIGGGNVALDMARIAKKNNANVLVVYYKDENDMKASKKEVEICKKENIEFIFNTTVKQIIKKVNNYSIYLITNTGFKFIYPCDYVFMAIGSRPNDLVNRLGLKLDIDGYVKTDKNLMTSIDGVFAGGDLIREISSVAHASASGKKAAYFIDLYLKKC